MGRHSMAKLRKETYFKRNFTDYILHIQNLKNSISLLYSVNFSPLESMLSIFQNNFKLFDF